MERMTQTERSEFRELSGRLFGNASFVVLPQSAEATRYNELAIKFQSDRLLSRTTDLPQFAKDLLQEIALDPEKEYHAESRIPGEMNIYLGLRLLKLSNLIVRTEHNKTTGLSKFKVA